MGLTPRGLSHSWDKEHQILTQLFILGVTCLTVTHMWSSTTEFNLPVAEWVCWWTHLAKGFRVFPTYFSPHTPHSGSTQNQSYYPLGCCPLVGIVSDIDYRRAEVGSHVHCSLDTPDLFWHWLSPSTGTLRSPLKASLESPEATVPGQYALATCTHSWYYPL